MGERIGVAWDISPAADAHDIYRVIPGSVAFDACTVVAKAADADAFERRLRRAGAFPTNRRRVRYGDGGDGGEGWFIADLRDGAW